MHPCYCSFPSLQSIEFNAGNRWSIFCASSSFSFFCHFCDLLAQLPPAVGALCCCCRFFFSSSSFSLSHYSLLLLSSPYLGVPLSLSLSLSLSCAIYRWSQTALSLLFCGLKSLAGFLSIMDFDSSWPRETADRYHHSSEAIGKMEKRTPGSHNNSRCRSINTRKAKQAKLWEKEERSSKKKPTKNTYCNKFRANNDTQKKATRRRTDSRSNNLLSLDAIER